MSFQNPEKYWWKANYTTSTLGFRCATDVPKAESISGGNNEKK